MRGDKTFLKGFPLGENPDKVLMSFIKEKITHTLDQISISVRFAA